MGSACPFRTLPPIHPALADCAAWPELVAESCPAQFEGTRCRQLPIPGATWEPEWRTGRGPAPGTDPRCGVMTGLDYSGRGVSAFRAVRTYYGWSMLRYCQRLAFLTVGPSCGPISKDKFSPMAPP